MPGNSTSSQPALLGDEKRRYVADLFSRIAPRYDLMNTLMTAGMHHRWRKIAATIASNGVEGTALDVATGTGDLALALARKKGVTGVVGLDLLQDMAARAHSKASSKGQGSATQFAVGDGLSLPFPDSTFSCATSAWGLRNMPDLRGSLEEMVRVVRPGGKVVSLESMPVEKGVFKPVFRLFFHSLVPFLGQIVGRNRAAYTYLPQSVENFLTVGALAQLFETVGLQDVGYRTFGLGAVAVHWGTKAGGGFE